MQVSGGEACIGDKGIGYKCIGDEACIGDRGREECHRCDSTVCSVL